MNGLEAPDHLSCAAAQSDQAVGVTVVARTKAAIVIGTRTANRKENEACGFIADDPAPGVCPTSLNFRFERVKGPSQGTRFNIKGSDFTARHIYSSVVRDCTSCNDEVTEDRWRAGDFVFAHRARRFAEALCEIDLTIFRETTTAHSGRFFETNQTTVDRACIEPFATDCDATADEVAVGTFRIHIEVDFQISLPVFASSAATLPQGVET